MEKRKMSGEKLASMIDHTELRIDATYNDIKLLCLEAEKYGFATVAIHPVNVPLAVSLLKDTNIKVDTAVGFHHGNYPTELKVFETRDAVEKGAKEIDFVMNIGALKAKRDDLVREDMLAIKEAAGNLMTKVILETCLLTDGEKRRACEIAKEAGVDFVKTSTGFGEKGATVEDVKLMKEVVGDEIEVKASGGIRSVDDALSMIEAGASRIGTSSGVQIVEDFIKSA